MMWTFRDGAVKSLQILLWGQILNFHSGLCELFCLPRCVRTPDMFTTLMVIKLWMDAVGMVYNF
jgi:hypothetical protein